MKRLNIISTVVFTMLVACISCYYDSEEDLYPAITQCDTTSVTFSGKIATLLANNCLTCHSNAVSAASGGGIRLENYADVVAKSTAVGGAMKHTGGYSPMPKNGGMLKACLITQFDIWVTKGMQNN